MTITCRYASIYFFSAVLFFTGCAAKRPATQINGDTAEFVCHAPFASKVAVAGDFNHWEPERDSLSGPDEQGFWRKAMRLPAGRYEYLFVINGSDWVTDPAAFAADDGMGGANSVIIIQEP